MLHRTKVDVHGLSTYRCKCRESQEKKSDRWHQRQRHSVGTALILQGAVQKNHRGPYRMKLKGLLSTVDRLPTINEMKECDQVDGDSECSTHTMEEYVESIKELSQPAPYPRHGPLRGHRRWMARLSPSAAGGCSTATPVAPYHSSMAYAPWAPIGLSDVSLVVAHQSNCETSTRYNHNPLDWLFAQSLFAGLV